MALLTADEIRYFQAHQNEITQELLSELRKCGKTGKQQALDILDMHQDEEKFYLDAYGERISYNGSRGLKKSFTKLKLYDIHLQEIERCSNDILYFLDNYIKMTTPKDGFNFIDSRDYQRDFLKLMSNDSIENIISMQPRQASKTTTCGVKLAHLFCFERDLTIGIIAYNGESAREFLDKAKKMIIALPIWIQPGMNVWNKGSIECENNVRILTDVPSGDSFRGFTCNIILVDECSYLEPKGWNEFLDGVMPSQSSLSFKKNIILSTPKGKNHFYDMWEAAGDTPETSSNDYVRFFVDWKRVPRYKSDGTLYTPEEFERVQVKKYGQVYFNSAYACRFEGSDFTLIPGEILGTYKTQEPIDLDIRGQLKIYAEPVENHKYIIGVDSSKEGQDFTGIQIFDCTELKFKQVASAKLQIDYLMVPEILDTYGKKYNSALIIIENNEGSGQSIADILARDYEYDNIFYEYRLFKGIRKRLGYPGFRTTKLTRDLMLQVVRMIATSGRLELCDSETIKEFETFTLVNGKYQANGPKAHDDLVMATLLCFAIFKDTKTFEDIQAIIDGLKTGESLDEGLIGIDTGFADFGPEGNTDNGEYGAYGLW